jgi:toxin ParE1/3/4
MKSYRIRTVAEQDIRKAVSYYVTNVGASVANDFLSEIEARFGSICEYPDAGSSYYAGITRIVGLRDRTLTRFPYAIFYVERDDYVEVLRVLHTARDIPRALRR